MTFEHLEYSCLFDKLHAYEKSRAKDKSSYVKTICDYLISIHDIPNTIEEDSYTYEYCKRTLWVYTSIVISFFIKHKDFKSINKLVSDDICSIEEIIMICSYHHKAEIDHVIEKCCFDKYIFHNIKLFDNMRNDFKCEKLEESLVSIKEKYDNKSEEEIDLINKQLQQLGISKKDLEKLLKRMK